MAKIFKYKLTDTYEQRVDLPKGARILDVAMQYGVVTLWALVDDTVELEPRDILSIGTGHSMPEAVAIDQFKHIKTLVLHQGVGVLHIFVKELSHAKR